MSGARLVLLMDGARDTLREQPGAQYQGVTLAAVEAMAREHVRGRTGEPISTMTLHRWREKGVIRVHTIAGRNYVRLHETLARLAGGTEIEP